MNVITVNATQKPNFLFPIISKTDIVDARTYDTRATLAALNIGS